jgi:8-oxo-dGTP pyrophosphatase MutT (NUDIX family)
MGGGGLLPTAIKNNKLYFLFGLENELDDTPGWADFGGGAEEGETVLDTAIREGGEEINGMLGYGEKLKKRVKQNKIANIVFKTYTTFIFKTDYDANLPSYYKNNYEFFSKYLPEVKAKLDNGLLEKSKIRWFSIDELKTERNTFRSFYQHIVDLIIKQYSFLLQKMKAKESTKKNKAHGHKSRTYKK